MKSINGLPSLEDYPTRLSHRAKKTNIISNSETLYNNFTELSNSKNQGNYKIQFIKKTNMNPKDLMHSPSIKNHENSLQKNVKKKERIFSNKKLNFITDDNEYF